MAFYGYNAYDYDFFPIQSPSRYSGYGFEEHKLIEHNSHNHYVSDPTHSSVYYSFSGYNEPRIIQYERPCYANDEHLSPKTNYTISYSTLEFSEPSFDEYDPTPYSGGYDPVATYGKPLPASDAICYPRTSPQPNVVVPDGFSYGSISSAYGEKTELPMNHQNGNSSKPDDNKEPKQYDDREENEESQNFDSGEDENATKVIEVDAIGADEDSRYDYGKGLGNGGCGYDEEYYDRVPNISYGSGLEAMDLCESMFGYWPCLAKINQQNQAKSEAIDDENQMDPWKSAADYLFGNGFVGTGMSNGYDFHGNQSYY